MQSSKPDSTCALRRKAGTVTPFSTEQSVLCSPACRGSIAKQWASFAYLEGRSGAVSLHLRLNGGESGIRTHVTLSSKHAFQACAFSHSAISPAKPGKENRAPVGYRMAPSRLDSRRLGFIFILWSGAHERKWLDCSTAGTDAGTRERRPDFKTGESLGDLLWRVVLGRV